VTAAGWTLRARAPPPAPPAPPAPAPGKAEGTGASPREADWLWDQIFKRITDLAAILCEAERASPARREALDELCAREEALLDRQTEIALHIAELEERESEVRQQVAQLRYAVTDLSLQRDLPAKEPRPESAPDDLDYQIETLERRIQEVWRGCEAQALRHQSQLDALRQALTPLREQITEIGLRLLAHLQRERPADAPRPVIKRYEAIEALLEATRSAPGPR
jgi:predicted  nucleic acid-binding Zn-ribbon protein